MIYDIYGEEDEDWMHTPVIVDAGSHTVRAGFWDWDGSCWGSAKQVDLFRVKPGSDGRFDAEARGCRRWGEEW